MRLLDDKHSACCLPAAPAQRHDAAPEPVVDLNCSDRVQRTKALLELKSKSATKFKLCKYELYSNAPLAHWINWINWINWIAHVALHPGRSPLAPLTPGRLFQRLRRDVGCSAAAPGDQGIRHGRRDRVKDPHLQRLRNLRRLGEIHLWGTS